MPKGRVHNFLCFCYTLLMSFTHETIVPKEKTPPHLKTRKLEMTWYFYCNIMEGRLLLEIGNLLHSSELWLQFVEHLVQMSLTLLDHCVNSYSVLKALLWGKYSYHLHFTDGEIDWKRWHELSRVLSLHIIELDFKLRPVWVQKWSSPMLCSGGSECRSLRVSQLFATFLQSQLSSSNLTPPTPVVLIITSFLILTNKLFYLDCRKAPCY